MNTAGVTTPVAVQTTTADGTGTVNYPLDYVGGTTTGSVTVTEAQQAGFTLQPVGGQNAVCLNLSTNPATAVPVANTALGFTVDVPSSQAVSCTVYNRAPNPPASITVAKNSVINGVPYANGAQPSNFSLNSRSPVPAPPEPPTRAGRSAHGVRVGDTATISESGLTVIDPTMCTTTSVVTTSTAAPATSRSARVTR